MTTQPADTENLPDEEELAPPEPRFWKRYSPHHEFGLSASSSLVLHGAIVGLAVVIGYFLINQIEKQSAPLPVGAIMIQGGGGGNPAGVKGGAPGVNKVEDVGKTKDKQPDLPKDRPGLVTPKVKAIDLPEPEPMGDKLIEQAKLASRTLQETRSNLIKSLDPDLGKGGPGTGGGKGKGKGTGVGDFTGPGWAPETRIARPGRWHLNFDASGIDDCLRKFGELDIILAVHQPGGKYRIYRNLGRRPLVGVEGDPGQLNKDWQRIPIEDKNPQSLAFMAKALGLRARPFHILAFIPRSLEADLVKKEVAFRGVNEKAITFTVFRMVRENGKLIPKVVEQR